jgi:hypothetical protein
MDLLTTYTHDSWLHLIIAPSPISTLYKSLQHTRQVFSVCCIFSSRSLATASNSGGSSASALTSLPANSQLHRLSLFFTDCLTNDHCSKSKSMSKILYDLWFTTNQFVLVSSPLRIAARVFFQLNPCGHSPYVTSSLTIEWVCLLWTGFASPLSNVHIAHKVRFWKFILVHYI